jgi:ADP-ribose pyrophosphatase YjhB (NUDIX family)
LPVKKSAPYIPHLAYDSVIFGFSSGRLNVLVMKYRNTGLYALPGGFVRANQDLDDAVQEGLKERTGLDNIYLEQFHTFGSLARFNPGVMKTILEANGTSLQRHAWMMERFVSVAYYALINYEDVTPRPDALSDSCDWYDVDRLPKLMLDHAIIVGKALQTLRDNLERKLVGVNLLPTRFTMKELQNVYEVILGRKLHRGTFQRKMLALGMLKRHEKQFSGGAHKAPYLYSFRKPRQKKS